MLIPKKGLKVGGKHIIPDGTLQDGNFLRRGYWEAKDTTDNLDAEITKKRKKGYPLANTIFEDTQRAVLFQNGAEAERYDLTKPQAVADLLTRFYSLTEPDIEGFEDAVDEFKDRVPGLPGGLKCLVFQPEGLGALSPGQRPSRLNVFESFVPQVKHGFSPRMRRPMVARGEVRLCERNPWKHGN